MTRLAYIGSLAALGKCSLTVAMPVLSAMGVEVCPLPTVVLSTHTGGLGTPYKADMTDALVPMARHIRSTAAHFDGIYTGYMGSAAQARAARECVDILRDKDTLVFCDPAMADGGRLYASLAQGFEKEQLSLCKGADYILPNLTEAALLAGAAMCAPDDKQGVLALLEALRALTGAMPVITGASLERGMAGAAYIGRDGIASAKTALLPGAYHGAGDLFSAVFMACVLDGQGIDTAAAAAAEHVRGCIARTATRGSDERLGLWVEGPYGKWLRP